MRGVSALQFVGNLDPLKPDPYTVLVWYASGIAAIMPAINYVLIIY
jgi:hypothetical protein